MKQLVFQSLMGAEAVEEGVEHRPGCLEMRPLDLLTDAGDVRPDPDVGQSQAVDRLRLPGIALLRLGEDDLLLDGEVPEYHLLELAERGGDERHLVLLEGGEQSVDQIANFSPLRVPTLEGRCAACLGHGLASLLRIFAQVAMLLGAVLPARAADLAWRECRDGLECATLSVPRDHARPRAGLLDLALIRRPAGAPARRIGPLVLNPGGPGASGVTHLRAAVARMDPQLLERFDVVSFDPRGVGGSAPLDCQGDLELWMAADPSPDSEEEWTSLIEAARAVALGCANRHAALLPHLGTLDVARDLELLRQALGAEQLSYLGVSYGSVLGAAYAHLHPERVRGFVLDGAVDPELTLARFTLEQSIALERAFVRPAALLEVEARIERSPLPSAGGGRPASTGDLALALVASRYEPNVGLRALARALDSASTGDGSGLVELADAYLQIRPDGGYANSFEASLAVICLDLAAPRTLPAWRARAAELARRAPLFGLANWSWALPCVFWPAGPTPLPQLSAVGSAPILVVARSDDPVTPFAWAEALATRLGSAVLLPVGGYGHTSSLRGDACVDSVIRAYLIDGRLPRVQGSGKPSTLKACR